MVNAVNWESNPALVSYNTAGLNALANDAKAIGAAIDNSTGLDMYMDTALTIAVQAVARSVAAYAAIYLLPSLDGGSTYCYGNSTTDPPACTLVATMPLDATTAGRYVTATTLLVPPGHFKLVLENKTGQAFGAANNVLEYRLYSEEIQ
jgi:hypothetical protein